jgi:glutaminyl-peptide cyclotransferase
VRSCWQAAASGQTLRAALCGLLLLCENAGAAPALPYEVVARYPHRSDAFTQGLELDGDTLYESSGLYGRSFLARWQLDGKHSPFKQTLGDRYFGEGLTLWGDKIYLLTWQNELGLIFD